MMPHRRLLYAIILNALLVLFFAYFSLFGFPINFFSHLLIPFGALMSYLVYEEPFWSKRSILLRRRHSFLRPDQAHEKTEIVRLPLPLRSPLILGHNLKREGRENRVFFIYFPQEQPVPFCASKSNSFACSTLRTRPIE